MTSLMGYIRRVEREQDRRAAYAHDEWLYALRVSPSCPPSKTVRVRGGKNYMGNNSGDASFDGYEYRAYTIPDLNAVLGDMNSVVVDVVFSQAHFYQFFLLELMLPAEIEEPTTSDWSFYLHGTGNEFATAGETEEWLSSETFQESNPWDHGSDGIAYPLCGLVLRNDGNIGAGCNILSIDAVNRGRSYIWPRDMRPLQQIAI